MRNIVLINQLPAADTKTDVGIVAQTVRSIPFSKLSQGLKVNHNLYWDPQLALDNSTLAPRLTPFGSWADWRTAGWDTGSLVAAPLFMDAANGNFQLQTDSPALPLGFQPLPDGADQC
jgi:hypothetical protein